ncbi:MAG: hypothetical protein V4550_11085 [Gemmatimonadota bacterium]
MTPGLTPAIAISVSPTSVDIVQGASSAVTISLTRSGGFTGAVTVAAEGLTTGVTAAGVTIAEGQTSATMNVVSVATALATTGTVTLRATGTGVTSSAALGLTVRAAATPAITLAASPATLSVIQGGTGNVTLTLTRSGGFTGDVTVAAEGLPTGVTVANSTIATGQTSATLNVVVAATAAAATNTITFRATGTGVTAATATTALTVTAAATPSITLAASPAALNVTAGATGTVTLTLTRSGGFTGEVTVAAEGLPTGVTAANATIATGQTSATMTISAAASAAAATNTITFRATGTGVTAATATTALTVQAAAGGFTLALSPTTTTIGAGGSGTVNVTIARTGSFTGVVALTATGLPTGVTATFAPTSIAAGSTTATLTLTASASVSAGTTTVTVRGTGTGATDQTSTVAVTLTAAPSGGNVVWTFCGTSGLPLWVAAQDGSAAWTRLTGSFDSYSAQISSGKGGIAYVVAMSGGGFDLEVFYGTTAELVARGTDLCSGASGAGKTITAPVAGNGGTDLLLETLGRSTGALSGSTVTFNGVASGNVDLIASRSALSFGGSGVSYTLNKLIIRRGLSPAAGTALPTIDFNGAESFAPVSKNLTITNLGGDISTVIGTYLTANGSVAAYTVDPGTQSGARTYYGIPAANQISTDLHFLIVSGVQLSGVLSNTRTAGLVFKDATDKTIALGPALTTPVVSVLGSAPYARLRSTFTAQTQYNKYFVADYQQTGTNARKSSVQRTAGYGDPIVLDIPDLSGVSGFDNNWGLKAGAAVTWTMTATGWSGSGGIVNTPFIEGATYNSATAQGTVTP